MSITRKYHLRDFDLARLDVKIAAAITDSGIPDGLSYQAANGEFVQAMYEGAAPGSIEEAQADIAALQADTTQAEVTVTATVGGGTTGLIPATANYAKIVSDTATKQVSLPAATVGKKMRLYVTGAACELISAVAAHEVNDVVVGATNEAALLQNALYEAEYVATNKWILTGKTSLGAVIAAIVPDAL